MILQASNIRYQLYSRAYLSVIGTFGRANIEIISPARQSEPTALYICQTKGMEKQRHLQKNSQKFKRQRTCLALLATALLPRHPA